ncbi:hypothetical protein SARC_01163 [Sphaeroforma arctica JP610]|uniref:Mediator of RNA polymerase II transcription subunit 21 n=1 Tax=Sphaeroforma arctica JP610 TaxID=667725 RepID=A0A0L0GCT0_9EUKA|nr:hypothetical protein SARC_01163 [Sphaeroforma arctica JP610]KNC86696.1 hypothetical protein SARC_01163 [Sphaeroforma arctica JP610]|eukprot:XP_014160598.1 hypothetical protein SARC_01163 [Sphaeroforma arctica JP610]
MPPAVPGVPVQQPPQLGADCEEADVVFAREIVNTMREIDTIVDTLPSLEDNYDQQMRDLERLEEVNEQSGKNLSEAIDRGELYLSLIRAALDDIGDMALKAEPQEIESEEPEN